MRPFQGRILLSHCSGALPRLLRVTLSGSINHERPGTSGTSRGIDVGPDARPTLSLEPTYFQFLTFVARKKFPKISGGAGAREVAQERIRLQPLLRPCVVTEASLVGAEGVGVVVTPPLDEARRVLDVQQLMVKRVFDEPLREFAVIERLVDDDSVVRGVMVAEYVSRAALRPRQHGLLKLPVEVAAVEPLEQLVRS